jgi:hypothetical protein
MASRHCWNCRKEARQTPFGDVIRSFDEQIYMHAYTCDGCGVISVGLASFVEIYTFDGTVKQFFTQDQPDVEWSPKVPNGREFSDVPPNIAGAASEAYICQSVDAYRAAVLLARTVIEATCKDKDITQGTLKQKIDSLEESRLINPTLAGLSHQVRLTGTEMAHGDLDAAIDAEDCDDLLEFMSALLEEIYQRPISLVRRQEQNRQRKAERTMQM